MELETERNDQINAELEKYAISSLDEAVSLCDENGINVESIAKTIKEDVSELTIMAYCLGVAIAVKKDTKLASYVAIDIGVGIQTYLGNEFGEPKSGMDLGFEICNLLKDKESDDTTLIKDYNECIPFLELNNEEIYKITSEICIQLEHLMK